MPALEGSCQPNYVLTEAVGNDVFDSCFSFVHAVRFGNVRLKPKGVLLPRARSHPQRRPILMMVREKCCRSYDVVASVYFVTSFERQRGNSFYVSLLAGLKGPAGERNAHTQTQTKKDEKDSGAALGLMRFAP